MIFPELKRNERNSMKVSVAFMKGLFRRIFFKRDKKVFIIGFHKTGTTSLGKALQILGYKVCGSIKEAYDYRKHDLQKEYIFSKTQNLLKNYDAFQDTPWFLFYKELYDLYPDDNFILTIREPDKWLRSVQKHFGNSRFHYHDLIYGTADSIKDSDIYLEKYNQHNKDVLKFFQGKANFKVLNVESVTWSDLTLFLNTSTPITEFPHANKASVRGSTISKIRRFIKHIYYK